MSKNIVVCCDGTGNEYSDHNSNVVALYQALVLNDDVQVAYYHPGVGTEGSPSSPNRLEAAFSVVMGLAFGAGLLRYVGDAYRFLMNTYQPNDQVYLFGFSRGAYTVRALAGMLHMFGLLHPGNDGLIPYILRLYARRTRKAGGMTDTFQEAAGFQKTFSRPCNLHMVGVWDTVSSVGMIWDPLRLPYTAVNPTMKHGRHALSIDERRCFFRNNLWGAPVPGQTVKQVWFAGVHSDVGGSYPWPESGLSQITLEWMLCEAHSLGLLIDPAKAREVLGRVPPPPPVAGDFTAPPHESLRGAWRLLEVVPRRVYDPNTRTKHWTIPLGARRTIPAGSVSHQSVWMKVQSHTGYAPSNLPPGWQSCIEPWTHCDFTRQE